MRQQWRSKRQSRGHHRASLTEPDRQLGPFVLVEPLQVRVENVLLRTFGGNGDGKQVRFDPNVQRSLYKALAQL